jgi:nicotinamide-nucleotide amidase
MALSVEPPGDPGVPAPSTAAKLAALLHERARLSGSETKVPLPEAGPRRGLAGAVGRVTRRHHPVEPVIPPAGRAPAQPHGLEASPSVGEGLLAGPWTSPRVVIHRGAWPTGPTGAGAVAANAAGGEVSETAAPPEGGPANPATEPAAADRTAGDPGSAAAEPTAPGATAPEATAPEATAPGASREVSLESLDDEQVVAWVAGVLQERSWTLAVAESVTGGLLSNRFAAGPDAERWFRGGLVAYMRSVKQKLLATGHGPLVSERTAREMSLGVAYLLNADVAVAVTGAGGPDPHDGAPPGEVWADVRLRDHNRARQYAFSGAPAEICQAACSAAVRLLAAELRRVPGVRPPTSAD